MCPRAPREDGFTLVEPLVSMSVTALIVIGLRPWQRSTRPELVGFAGMIYAPDSRVYLGNSITFVGAIAADDVYLNNSVKFRFPAGLGGFSVGTPAFDDGRWVECRRAPPVAGDPESGC